MPNYILKKIKIKKKWWEWILLCKCIEIIIKKKNNNTVEVHLPSYKMLLKFLLREKAFLLKLNMKNNAGFLAGTDSHISKEILFPLKKKKILPKDLCLLLYRLDNIQTPLGISGFKFKIGISSSHNRPKDQYRGVRWLHFPSGKIRQTLNWAVLELKRKSKCRTKS